MKKFFFSVLLVFGFMIQAKADERVLFSYKGVEALLPMVNLQTVYCYDFVNSRNLVGAETAILRYKTLYSVVGLASDADPVVNNGAVKGIPYIGGHVSDLSFLNQVITIGGFVGRDFDLGENIAGAKASVRIW